MPVSIEDVVALGALEAKLQTMLPGQYHECYEEVRPVSMGSAPLKYGGDGRVAWNEIWRTFCDLAMAGGPPHRGTLLMPATRAEVSADPAKYDSVVEEISRGASMVTGLKVVATNAPGWVGLQCHHRAMAGWLMRAAVMENVLSLAEADVLYLPAGPEFRVEKEIKNVVTTVAKTCHYWVGHIPEDQQSKIDALLHSSELIGIGIIDDSDGAPDQRATVVRILMDEIGRGMTARFVTDRYRDWLGVECDDDRAAAWLTRAMLVENILVRREGKVLFLPVPTPIVTHAADSRILRLVEVFVRASRLQAMSTRGNGAYRIGGH